MEYIREELVYFSKGMSKSMKQKFGFVNVAGGAYNYNDIVDIMSAVLLTEYNPPAAAGA